MQVVNLATVSVTTTGTVIFTEDQARACTTLGLEAVGINPSVDVVLIDPTAGGGAYANIPNAAGTGQGAVAGTVANSPWVCPVGVCTTVLHRSGALKAISTSGTATVKISPTVAP